MADPIFSLLNKLSNHLPAVVSANPDASYKYLAPVCIPVPIKAAPAPIPILINADPNISYYLV